MGCAPSEPVCASCGSKRGAACCHRSQLETGEDDVAVAEADLSESLFHSAEKVVTTVTRQLSPAGKIVTTVTREVTTAVDMPRQVSSASNAQKNGKQVAPPPNGKGSHHPDASPSSPRSTAAPLSENRKDNDIESESSPAACEESSCGEQSSAPAYEDDESSAAMPSRLRRRPSLFLGAMARSSVAELPSPTSPGRCKSVSSSGTPRHTEDKSRTRGGESEGGGSECEDTSPSRPRRKRRPSIISQCAQMPSEALQCIIENCGSVEDFYTITTTLGKGTYGSVKVGIVNASGAKRAVKIMEKKDLKNNRALSEEIRILKMIDHLHIVKLFEVFETDDNLYLVMALSKHGNLTKYVSKQGHLGQARAKGAMRDLVSAINYLHNNCIAHRDVKPDNVLIHIPTPLSLRLTDFGLAKRFSPNQIFTSEIGTPCFMAPEVYKRKYNQSCDVFSAGVCLYFLLCGYLPFQGKSLDEIKHQILTKPPSYATAAWADVSADTWGFLDLMLKKNPRSRYTADQTFHHEWLKPTKKGDLVELSVETLQHLRTFRKGNKLKRSALIVIASMLKMNDIQFGHKVFCSLDTNGDGSISMSEMKDNLKSRMKDSDIKAMFEQEIALSQQDVEDEDRAKPFSHTEFIAATFDRKRCITKAICKAAFVNFDKDGDGKISMAELAQGQLLGHLSMEEMAETLEDLDTNGDCFIDFDEFYAMLLLKD